MKSITVFAVILVSAVNASGVPFSFESGATQVDLIELFTSEGCSSCPPAEESLGDMRHDDRLWSEFVPVAFHVHYWDRLGWRDRFASKAFTKRQYVYAEAWDDSRVYTPCFVRNGREWRHRGDSNRVRRETGVLKIESAGDGKITVTITPASDLKEKEFNAHLALLGGEIESRIRSGENRGKTLEHHFVALHLESISMKADDNGAFRAELNFPNADALETEANAVAAWITPRASVYPIQALGGWLNE